MSTDPIEGFSGTQDEGVHHGTTPRPRWIPVTERLPEMDLPPGDCRKSHTRHVLVLYDAPPDFPATPAPIPEPTS